MTTKAKTEDNLRMMDPETIMFNEYNPRSTITDLDELKASIEANGIIQPIAVRQFGTGYKVVAGSRRLAAAIQLGWPSIPVRIVVADDRKALELAVTENVIRKDMSTLDEIIAVGVLTESGETADDIAVRFGRTPRWVATYAKIAKMPQVVLDKIDAGELSLADAQELCRMSNRDDIERIANTGMSGLKRIVNDYIRELSDAPWVDKKSPCEKCLQRSDKQINLFKDGGPARCMDSVCWTQKRDAWIAKKEAELRKAGHLPIQPWMNSHVFDGCHGSILDDEEDTAQIAQLQEAGVKQRYRIDKDTFEIVLRWDWDDMPEKSVKTASGDEAPEMRDEADDLPECMVALSEADLAEDEPSEPEEPEGEVPSKYEIRRQLMREAERVRNEAAANIGEYAVKDWRVIVPFIAEILRCTCTGALDKFFDGLNESREANGMVSIKSLLHTPIENRSDLENFLLSAIMEECDPLDEFPILAKTIGMDYDAIKREAQSLADDGSLTETMCKAYPMSKNGVFEAADRMLHVTHKNTSASVSVASDGTNWFYSIDYRTADEGHGGPCSTFGKKLKTKHGAVTRGRRFLIARLGRKNSAGTKALVKLLWKWRAEA